MEEKKYRPLVQGDVIQDGDEYQSSNPPYDWKPASHGIGETWCSKRHVPYRRPLPQWQTGPIPEPTGFCIVVLEQESKDLSGHTMLAAVHSFLHKDGTFKWRGHSFYSPNGLVQIGGYTGRWFIQSIILPTK